MINIRKGRRIRGFASVNVAFYTGYVMLHTVNSVQRAGDIVSTSVASYRVSFISDHYSYNILSMYTICGRPLHCQSSPCFALLAALYSGIEWFCSRRFHDDAAASRRYLRSAVMPHKTPHSTGPPGSVRTLFACAN